jgi:hypothetical protein
MFNSFHHVGPSEDDFYIYFTHGNTANCFYSVVALLRLPYSRACRRTLTELRAPF